MADIRRAMNEQEILRCATCGDAIGTYEPIVVAPDGDERVTSLAREPELADSEHALRHKACALVVTS
jgi:hypothetical protein